MKKYKLVGLTGTTGAGKSEVSKIFAEQGYKVISADVLARKAVENQYVITLLTENFGADIIENNTLNRKLLGQRAFSSKENNDKLNAITHPFITSLFVNEIDECVKAGCDKILFDAPQLFESKINILCDVIISVVADETVRVERIIKRDNISKNLAQMRISAQYNENFFRENSDYIIENNFTVDSLRECALSIINKID